MFVRVRELMRLHIQEAVHLLHKKHLDQNFQIVDRRPAQRANCMESISKSSNIMFEYTLLPSEV